MIKYLIIKNFLIIKDIKINFSNNLNVIIGESGSGKSLIVDALKLLLGKKLNFKHNLEKKCIIEAEFINKNNTVKNLFKELDLDYEENIIIRREININKKSRVFVNDTPIKTSILKDITHHLMDVHSQFENTLFKDENFQLAILDSNIADSQIKEIFLREYSKYSKLKKLYDEKETLSRESIKEYDYNKFLIKELKKHDLYSINQKKLENEVLILENSEFLKKKLYDINQNISIENPTLYNIFKKFECIEEYSKDFKVLKKRYESILVELEDIDNEVNSQLDKINFDSELLENKHTILSHIYHLQKKHNLKDIISLRSLLEKLEKRNISINSSNNNLEACKKEYYKQKNKVLELANKLSIERKTIIESLKKRIILLLSDLDILNACLDIKLIKKNIDETGTDDIQILFSFNKGLKLNLIQNIASGGEISRLMFVFKYILFNKKKFCSVLLDEIDSGLSGEAAIKLGKMMKKISRNNQLIVVTHLPQVAINADKNLYIYKKSTNFGIETFVKELNGEDKIQYISKMIVGNNINENSLKSTKNIIESLK